MRLTRGLSFLLWLIVGNPSLKNGACREGFCPLCSPVKQVCRGEGAGPARPGVPQRGSRGRGKPGCSGTVGAGTGEAGSSRWDAAPRRWRRFQPARFCPGILEHRAPFGHVLCPDLAAGTALRRSATKAGPRPPQGCWLGCCAVTLPASACYLFLSLSFPPCFLSPLAFLHNGFSASRLDGSGVTAPPSRACPSPRHSCAAGSQCQHMAREKMVPKRQNTGMVPGDFNFFPLFLSALTFQVSDTNGLWWKSSKQSRTPETAH